MFPRMTRANMPDVRGLCIEAGGDLLVGQSFLTQCSDADDICLREFREWSCFSAMRASPIGHAPRMLLIFQRGNVFQILWRVMRSIAVNVVDLITAGTRADEGTSNECMNKWTPSIHQAHPAVIATRSNRFQDKHFHATDASVIAHLIAPVISRDIAPFFGRHGAIVTNYNAGLQMTASNTR